MGARQKVSENQIVCVCVCLPVSMYSIHVCMHAVRILAWKNCVIVSFSRIDLANGTFRLIQLKSEYFVHTEIGPLRMKKALPAAQQNGMYMT